MFLHAQWKKNIMHVTQRGIFLSVTCCRQKSKGRNRKSKSRSPMAVKNWQGALCTFQLSLIYNLMADAGVFSQIVLV